MRIWLILLGQATGTKNLAASTLIDVLYAGRLYRVVASEIAAFSLQLGSLPQQHEFFQVLEEEGRDNEGKLREIELLLDLTKERKDILGFQGFPWSLCILSQQFLFSSRAVDEVGGFVIPSVFFQVE